jgi:ribosome-interacting GTPase 1
MKVELRQIIDQLTEALELPKGHRVCAYVLDDNETIFEWNICKVDENSKIIPIFMKGCANIKELLEKFYNRL